MNRYTFAEIEAALPPESQAIQASGATTLALHGSPAPAARSNVSRLNAAAQAGLSDFWFDQLPERKKNEFVRAVLAHPDISKMADAPRAEWLRPLAAIADAARRGASDARVLALDWCKTSTKFKSEADFDRDWNSLRAPKPGGITVGTLIGAFIKVGGDVSPWRDQASATVVGPGASATVAQGAAATTATPFFVPPPFGAANLRPAQWVIPGMIMRGEPTVVVGQGGGAKTAFAVHVGVALAAGRASIGPFDVATRPGGLRVAFMSAEEDASRMGLMIESASVTLSLTATERANVQRNFLIHDAQSSGWRLGEPGPGQRAAIAPEAEDRSLQTLDAALRQFKPDVMILDTLSALFALPSEIDNNQITTLMRRLSRAARVVGCAVVLLHHTPKMSRESAAGQRGEATLVRGGSAITNSARVVFSITTLPDAEAGPAALQGYAPERLRRLEHVKVNDMLPMEPLLFEIVSVPVRVYDGSDHAVRAINFLPPMPSGGGRITDAVRNLAMKAIDAGVRDGHGAKVALSPGGGQKNNRDATTAVANALIGAVPGLSNDLHARTAAKEVIKDLRDRIGCVVEEDVQVPQYKKDGQPNGSKTVRGLVCRWHLAPWVTAAAPTVSPAPPAPSAPGAQLPPASDPPGLGIPPKHIAQPLPERAHV